MFLLCFRALSPQQGGYVRAANIYLLLLLYFAFSFVFISHLTNFCSLLCLCMYVYRPFYL